MSGFRRERLKDSNPLHGKQFAWSPFGADIPCKQAADADVERLRELVHLRDLLGVSLDEVRELVAAEDARAALRRKWRSGVEDPVRRREILDVALAHVDRQLGLVRRQASDRSELIGRRGLE